MLQTADWQNFIYLALILMVMLGGIIARRDFKLSKILKYLAIWSITGFTAIILYAYRYEFSDFRTKILGEINPSAVRVTKLGELVINLSQDGHFYIDLEINKIPIRFMIDTGASDITIGLPEAKRIGVNVEKLNFNKPYQTANGTSWGAYITLDEIRIANVKFTNVPASVNSSDMGTPLLGMKFLRQFRKYEVYQDKLVLII